jgi:hypothetical protein
MLVLAQPSTALSPIALAVRHFLLEITQLISLICALCIVS